MDLGDAKYTVTLEDKATEKMKSIEGSMGSMGATMAKAGAIVVAEIAAISAAIGKLLVDWMEAGDEVQKMAMRTQWSVESLSELRYAAKIAGTDISQFELGTRKLSGAIIDASDGLETYVRDFEKLGINVADLRKQPIEEQFWTVAYALADMEDATAKAAIAVDLFGRTGTNMFPLLAEGSEGIAQLREKAHELGITFDDVAANKTAAFKDATVNVSSAVDGAKYSLVENLGPALTDFMENTLVPAIEKFGNFIEKNQELVDGFNALVKGIAAVADALGWLIDAFKAIDDAIPDELQPILGMLTGRTARKAGEQYRELTGQTTEAPGLTPEALDWYAEWLNRGGFTAQFGGVVPGPVGQPIPIVAHGGERFLGQNASAGIVVNVAVGGSVVSERDLASAIRAQLLDISADNNGVGLA